MQTIEQIEILESFAQFTAGQIVAVDNSYTPTSRKLCERYVAKGRAKWVDTPTEHDPELEDAENQNAGITIPDEVVPKKKGKKHA